jgi:TrfA protein
MAKKDKLERSPLAAALERNDPAAWDELAAQRQAQARARGVTAQDPAAPAATAPAAAAISAQLGPGPAPATSAELPAVPAAAPSGQVVKLPPWAGELRACPSCVLRSALFKVIERGRRKALERAIVAAWPGVTIRYTGWQLDQADLDVWLTVLHIAREQALGMQVPVTAYQILKMLGKKVGKSGYEWLKVTTARLTAGSVEITVGTKTYCGSLIERFTRDEVTGHYVLMLNPDLVVLFEDNAFTRLEWEQRQGLHKDLAKWLHGYVLSHQATAKHPHRIGLERLQELCGSEREDLRFFRRDVREAIKELKNPGVVAAWRITEADALEVIRASQKPQILEGKRPRRKRAKDT